LALTNIRPVVAPAGRVKTELLDRLTGAYTAFQIARLSQTYFDLQDSGILAKLDGLFIRGLTAADSLINWVAGKPNAVNQGAAFSAGAGGGFTGDGTASWVDMAFAPTTYTLANAGLLAFVQSAVPGTDKHVIGGGSTTLANARLAFTPTQVTARLNTTTATVASYSADRSGLWTVHRAGWQSIRRNGDLIASSQVAAAALPNALSLFREGGTYGAHTVSAFGYGGNLGEAEARRLADILTAHHRAI